MFSLWQNTCYLWTFSISVIISTDSVSYYLKMIMLITLVGTLTQTRMDDFLQLGTYEGLICLAYGKVTKYQDFAIRRI